MPANHCVPHTDETKAKMRQSRLGKTNPFLRRESKILDCVEVWKCGNCKEFFPKDGFYKNNRTILGITSECKSCHSKTNVLSRDKQKANQRQIIYEARRRERSKLAGFSLQRLDLKKLKEILGENCLKCNSSLKIELDHVRPLSKGGLHHPTNLQFLCQKCNGQKHTKTVEYRSKKQIEQISEIWVISFKKV